MEPVEFGQGRRALRFGQQKINLHQAGREFEPKAATPLPGSADLCFVIDSPIEQAVDQLDIMGIELLEGPVQRIGATGVVDSVYLRDPDGNLVELSCYRNVGTD